MKSVEQTFDRIEFYNKMHMRGRDMYNKRSNI